MMLRLLLATTLIALAVAMTGCAGARGTTEPLERVRPGDAWTAPSGTSSTSISPTTATLEALLVDEIRSWDGTPHRWGGDSRAGVDCSAFVMRVYADALGVDLPRTTEAQALVGRSVRPSELAVGDLVFFQTAPKTRHVGIYLRDGEFAHAGTTEGVTRSRLDSDYWQRTYWMSRRILEPEDRARLTQSDAYALKESDVPLPARPLPSSEGREAIPRSVKRTGW